MDIWLTVRGLGMILDLGDGAFGPGVLIRVVILSCLSMAAGAARTAETMGSLPTVMAFRFTTPAQTHSSVPTTQTQLAILIRAARAMALRPVVRPGLLRVAPSPHSQAMADLPVVLRSVRRLRVPDRNRVHGIPMGEAVRSIE